MHKKSMSKKATGIIAYMTKKKQKLRETEKKDARDYF